MKKIFTAVALVVCASNAFAGDKGVYFKVEGGLAIPQKFNSANYLKKKADNSVVAGVGLGYDFGHGVSGDVTFSRFDKFKFNHIIATNTRLTQDISSNLFSVNGTYNFYKFGKVKPFVTAGLGVSHNEAGDYFTNNVSATNSRKPGKTHTQFAWNAGLGTAVEVTDNVDVSLAYKYFDLGRAETQNYTISSSGSVTSGNGVRANLKVHSAMAGFKVKF